MTSTMRMMRKKSKKRRKTIVRVLAWQLSILFVGFCLPSLASENAAEKDKEKAKKVASYSVVAGTVFRPPGFALPGAEVTLKPEKGKGQQHSTANTRGEFAFRVPPVFARYTVSVKASGFQSEEKSAEVGVEQRVDLAFELKPKTKP